MDGLRDGVLPGGALLRQPQPRSTSLRRRFLVSLIYSFLLFSLLVFLSFSGAALRCFFSCSEEKFSRFAEHGEQVWPQLGTLGRHIVSFSHIFLVVVYSDPGSIELDTMDAGGILGCGLLWSTSAGRSLRAHWGGDVPREFRRSRVQ